MRLTAKFLVAVAVVLTLVLIVDAAMQVRHETEIFLGDLSRDHRVLGRTLRVVLQEALANDIGRTEALLRAADHGTPGVRVRLITIDTAAPEGVPDAADVAALGAQRERDHLAGETFYTWVPLRYPDGSLRAIEVRETLGRERAWVRRSVRRNALLAVGNILLLGVVVGLLGWWFVGRPARALVEKARRVGAGDLSSPVVLRQRDEMGVIGREMNAMCDQLADARRQVAAQSEARVTVLEQLRHADRLRTVGQLASSIAHELGTPLNVVQGRAELLREVDGAPAEVAEHANIIAAQARRMTAHLRRLMDFSRRRQGDRARTDLRALAQQTVELLAPMAHKRRVSLRVHGAKVEAEVDAGQMQQVLTNLVVNAIQASPDGSSVEITTGPSEAKPPGEQRVAPGPYASLSVSDEGRGVAPEDIGRIFEAFFTTKGAGEGTGLGLPVAWEIVREHGGWIEVESEPGEGARFTVHVPYALQRDTLEEMR